MLSAAFCSTLAMTFSVPNSKQFPNLLVHNYFHSDVVVVLRREWITLVAVTSHAIAVA